MSSRAVRKLQKLREQEFQQNENEDESSEDEPVARPSKPKFNAFDLLNAAEEEEEEEEEGVVEEKEEAQDTPVQSSQPVAAPSQPAASSKKKKSKNKKKKPSPKPADTEISAPTETREKGLDEIDRALKDLAVEKPAQGGGGETAAAPANTYDDSFPKTPEELLAVEPKFLNAINEMKKLFGNVVLENFDEEDAGTGRRRGGREMIDLGRALTGRYCPATRGQSFAGVTLRRNALMQAKDEWPRAPSGGLGMEMVEKLPDGSIKYRLVHNSSYQDVQRQFDMCVESMDPQRLIHLLQYNPYHLSTLLQVSDVAKHQGDHAVSADLLERALFNIGRSAHSWASVGGILPQICLGMG